MQNTPKHIICFVDVSSIAHSQFTSMITAFEKHFSPDKPIETYFQLFWLSPFDCDAIIYPDDNNPVVAVFYDTENDDSPMDNMIDLETEVRDRIRIVSPEVDPTTGEWRFPLYELAE